MLAAPPADGVVAGAADAGMPDPEWSAVLEDPVMARFAEGLSGPDGAVSMTSPAERGLWRDISLARRMEAALRASEAQFEAVFDSAPTAMLIAAAEDGRPGRLLRVNLRLCALTGYSAWQLLDLRVAQLEQPAPDGDGVRADGGRRGAVGADEQVQRWVHADGHGYWVLIRTAPVQRAGDETVVCQVEAVLAAPGSQLQLERQQVQAGARARD